MENIKKIRFLRFAVLGGLIFGAGTLSAVKSKDTYGKIVVTPENIYKVAPKAPKELRNLVLGHYKFSPQDLNRVKTGGNNRTVNIVRPFYGYVEKVSGLVNRYHLVRARNNLMKENKKWITHTKMYYLIRHFLEGKQGVPTVFPILTNTYQTASRMFYHLRIMDTIKRCKLEYIARPKSYLIDVTGGTNSDDKHCAFYEKELSKDFKPLNFYLKKKNLLKKVLPEKSFKELLIVIRETGLWNFNGKNIMININTGKIVPVDTEQPNTMKPNQLFNCDWNKLKGKQSRHNRYLHNVIAGLMSLYDRFRSVNAFEYCGMIREFTANTRSLYGASTYKSLVKKFLRDAKFLPKKNIEKKKKKFSSAADIL